MRRTGSWVSIAIIVSVVTGMATGGYIWYGPTELTDILDPQINEVTMLTKSKSLHDHLRSFYMERAMNWSFYQTQYALATGASWAHKNMSEDNITGEETVAKKLRRQADADFHANYLDSVSIPRGCEYEVPQADFPVDDRYAMFDGKDGLKVSPHTVQPMKIICDSDTGNTTIFYAPMYRNMTQWSRFFHLQNITLNMTSNPAFRKSVEMVARNVSTRLQIETNPAPCVPSSYGDGTNTMDPPYNDGPDCQSNASLFQGASLDDMIEQAANKYEDRNRAELVSALQDIALYYEDPSRWDPKGPNSRFEDVDVTFEVVELEYRLENVQKVYLDRKVTSCEESHSGTFYEGYCGASASVFGDSCSCDWSPNTCDSECGTVQHGEVCPSCTRGTCDENCNGVGSETVTVLGSCSNADCGTTSQVQSDTSISTSCPGSASCSCPGDWPTNTNPPWSVNDGSDEFYGMDCPGEKTYGTSPRQSSCELDNVCNPNPNGYRLDASTPRSGDATDYPDEMGQFEECQNVGAIIGDNPWYLKASKTYSDPLPGPGAPSWSDPRFTQRLWEGDYSLSTMVSGVNIPVLLIFLLLTAATAVLAMGQLHMFGATLPVPDTVSLLGVIRLMNENRTPIITGAMALYLGAYLVFGVAGIAFQAQPAAAQYCPSSSACTNDDSCSYRFDATCDVNRWESAPITDTADENERVQTTAEYKYDLKAFVRLKITVTDTRYTIPTSDGEQPLEYVVFYDQYASSLPTSACDATVTVDPDG